MEMTVTNEMTEVDLGWEELEPLVSNEGSNEVKETKEPVKPKKGRPRKEKTIVVKPAKSNQYVNEHILTILLTMFKNYDGSNPTLQNRKEKFKTLRAQYNLTKAQYDTHLAESNKLNSNVQVAFKKMLDLALEMYPTNEEIVELNTMIKLICERSLRTFGGYNLDLEEVQANCFERILRYKYNFDPLRKSKITGQRVNSFSYVTQMIKNVIFELTSKRKKIDHHEVHEALDSEFKEDFWDSQTGQDYLNDIEAQNKTPDSEIIDAIIKNKNKITDVEKYLRNVSEEFDIDAEELIEVILSYDLLGDIKTIVTKNRWDF